MDAFSVINAITACFFFSVGLYAVLINWKSNIHRFFSLTCLCLFIWAFCAIFIFSTDKIEIATNLYKISCIGFFFHYSFNLHFCIQLAGFKIKKIYYFILYLFPVIFSIMAFVDYTVYVDFIRENNTWRIVLNLQTPWSVAYTLYGLGAMILCVICLILWNRNSFSKKVKKQSILLACGNVFLVGLGFAFAYTLKYLFKTSNASFSPLFLILWIGFAFYAITRYQFLSLTPDKIKSNILTAINDSVIFMSQDYKIITINEKARDLLEIEDADLTGKDAEEIVDNFSKIKSEIVNIRDQKYNNFSCRINFLKKVKVKVLMDLKISLVKDKFDDLIGILIIGQEVKELKQFKSRYNITDREAQIIENILYGKTNKQMSDELNVSENTIKSHIQNIYNKLAVSNRMELLNFLKDFNLFPETSADRTKIFFNKEK